jgi:hypothetical protein
MCSNSPHEDGNPAMSWIPSCVEVDAMVPQGIWQPQTPVPDFTEVPPTPPDRETIYERYINAARTLWYLFSPPEDSTYDDDQWIWNYDESAYDAALAQWNLDSSNFLSGSPPELLDTSVLDTNAQGAALNYHAQDVGWLWEELEHEDSTYNDSLSTYAADSTRHFTGNDVPYTQIWNQTQADTDANDALQEWLNQCSPPVPPTGILSVAVSILLWIRMPMISGQVKQAKLEPKLRRSTIPVAMDLRHAMKLCALFSLVLLR